MKAFLLVLIAACFVGVLGYGNSTDPALRLTLLGDSVGQILDDNRPPQNTTVPSFSCVDLYNRTTDAAGYVMSRYRLQFKNHGYVVAQTYIVNRCNIRRVISNSTIYASQSYYVLTDCYNSLELLEVASSWSLSLSAEYSCYPKNNATASAVFGIDAKLTYFSRVRMEHHQYILSGDNTFSP